MASSKANRGGGDLELNQPEPFTQSFNFEVTVDISNKEVIWEPTAVPPLSLAMVTIKQVKVQDTANDDTHEIKVEFGNGGDQRTLKASKGEDELVNFGFGIDPKYAAQFQMKFNLIKGSGPVRVFCREVWVDDAEEEGGAEPGKGCPQRKA